MRRVLVGFLFLVSAMLTTPTMAVDGEIIRKLKRENGCPHCNLAGADLYNSEPGAGAGHPLRRSATQHQLRPGIASKRGRPFVDTPPAPALS